MKRNKTMVFGVLCGVACAVLVFIYMQEVGKEAETARAEALARYGGEQVEVCVARRDIAMGEVVDSGSVEVRTWVADLLPRGALRDPSQVIGKKASSAIYTGEVLCEPRFQELKSQIDIPNDTTAISVPAKDVQAVGGAIKEGDRVDMYATGGTSTSVIAKNVLVLSTNAASGGETSETKMTWITVAVKPELVQEVVTAAQRMELYFVLPGATKVPADTLAGKEKGNAA